ncbi:MAG: DUF4230 domain-containing protein [Deltaproteobacteria bacterium]|nr:DUF4230 domain-containing protein [Deltaproteobacteria bacterium]
MRRIVMVLVGVLLGLVGGLLVAFQMFAPRPKPLPDGPTVITQMREAARLETLDVSVYKKLNFAPDPPAPSDSTWQNVVTWARYNLRDPHGRAILFATVHLGLDLQQLDENHVRVDRDRVLVVLPPVISQVELDPGATEIIDSNLDSAETAQLLEQAKQAFAHDASTDPKLRERARASSERALRALVRTLGYGDLQVVPALPAHSPT